MHVNGVQAVRLPSLPRTDKASSSQQEAPVSASGLPLCLSPSLPAGPAGHKDSKSTVTSHPLRPPTPACPLQSALCGSHLGYLHWGAIHPRPPGQQEHLKGEL